MKSDREDDRENAEDDEVELLDPAIRPRLEGAHGLGEWAVFVLAEGLLEQEARCEEDRADDAGPCCYSDGSHTSDAMSGSRYPPSGVLPMPRAHAASRKA